MIALFLAVFLQGAGPADKQIVDAAAADRGKTMYIAECITCHGAKARGTETGADLVRSVAVLRDRFGSELGTFLRNIDLTSTRSYDEIVAKVAARVKDTPAGRWCSCGQQSVLAWACCWSLRSCGL